MKKHAKAISGYVKTYKITAVIFAASVAYLALALGYGLNVFEQVRLKVHEMMVHADHFEGDEVILVLVLVSVALFLDLIRLRHKARRDHEIDQHRVEVMRLTMSTVHDVVNNFLNNLQLFRLEAERSQALNGEYLKLFDDLIEETAQKIKDIENMEVIAERQICKGMTALGMPNDIGKP